MAVNLTSGAITKLMTGECTENDLKPVLQVFYTDSRMIGTVDNKQWYFVALSDGSFWEIGFIPKKLQEGSIVQLTKYRVIKDEMESGIFGLDLNLLRTTCDIIGDPKLLPDNETPIVERTAPTIPDEDHVDSHLNEDTDDSHHVEEPPTSKQKPSTSTQKCSSHSPTQNKKRKLQPSDDIISGSGKDISKLVSMTVEKTIEDGLGACYEKLGTLEEGVSKMTGMMMEKNKEVDAGFKKLETLEEEVFKLTKLMMEKNKEDVVGFKKLETLEEDVSKMAKMMTDKNKEDDMGACIEKLDKMGWGAEEPIYDTALLLFLKGADYRKLWLHLKQKCCGKWVKIAGSIFGLLD